MVDRSFLNYQALAIEVTVGPGSETIEITSLHVNFTWALHLRDKTLTREETEKMPPDNATFKPTEGS